jgi:hypothetical protein
VVESGGLENRCVGNPCTEGSNPSPSAWPRLARLILVVAAGVALAVFGPDRRRAPDVEQSLAARIYMHGGMVVSVDHLKCVRTEKAKTYICDVRINYADEVAQKPVRLLVTAPSAHPNY